MFLIIWLILILFFSVIPVSQPKFEMPVDKFEHGIIYGLTAVFFYRYSRPKTTRIKAGVKAVFSASAYGAAIEFIQYFLPYRSFSLADMAVNTFGAFAFCMIYAKWRG